MSHIVNNMPFSDYAAVDAVSNSELDNYAVSAKYAQWRKSNPISVTRAMVLGQLVDCMLTTPADTDLTFYKALDLPRRSNADKERHAEHERQHVGMICIDSDDWTKAEEMVAAVHEHPLAAPLVKAIDGQVCCFFEIDGTACKSRLDGYASAINSVIEIKTVNDASPTGFPALFARRGFHRKAAFYRRAASACGLQVDSIIFIAISNGDCPDVTVWQIPDSVCAVGDAEVLDLLALRKASIETNQFNGFSRELLTLELPRWFKRNTTTEEEAWI